MPESITATVQADEEQAIQADEGDPAPPGDRLNVLANVEGLRAAWDESARAVFDRRKAAIRAKARVGVGVGAMTD